MRVLMYCWSCGKEHDMTNMPYKHSYRCDVCDGYVITPSGKTKSKIVYDESTVYGNDCPTGKCEF